MVLSRKATLVRPPSVSASKSRPKKDVLSARKIAGVRIHVEWAIRRIREFKLLAPHAVLNYRLVCLADHAIPLVCGLINMQSSLIK
jgi:hypothetical protein